ncbi:MAG TPA: hypothetical protein VFU63_04495 [Ktedonobacterales bacterium]|nr:hypothetical protein [Ktedonobacterales bacterium]
MNIEISKEQREAFRDWLRAKLRELDFYQRRGEFYLIREFHKYTIEKGHPIDEASLGRYINRDNPVVPTTVTCRDLGAILGIPAIDVMKAAGLVRDEDWETPPDWEERQERESIKGA